ncbi:hypothetical protein [Solimonas soli]|uniref:hypothetical protein n=1 Tax=Solimonas soli TaxID=413479 RepID=UPI0004B54A2A|nr:hypothetical protein [Solimonas soli]
MRAWRMIALPALLWPLIATAIPEGPDYPSAAWTAREAQNFARVLEAPTEEVATRDGRRAQCEDIRAGCAAPQAHHGGGAFGLFGALLLLGAALLRGPGAARRRT